MKTIYIPSFIFMLLVLSGCEKNLIEKPFSFLEEASSFKTADDANSALNGVYADLRDIYNIDFLDLSNLNSDEGDVREDNALGKELHRNFFNSGTSLFDEFYTNSYVLIDRANRVIQFVPKIEMDEKLKGQIIGEAKFLRALSYFNLVRAFGDVPLVSEISNDVVNVKIPRDPVDQVYALIIEDLKAAEAVLPIKHTASGTIGRATSGAAKSILAKVYLTLGEWTNAAQKAKEVIDSGQYDLFNDYREVFLPETENGIEHIFSVQYSCTLPQYGSNMAVNYSIYFSYPINLIGGSRQVNTHLAESFVDGDYRKDVTVIYEKQIADGTVVASRTGPHMDKYWDPLACSSASARNNFIVVRYSDVLLMYAEALNEINGPNSAAYEAINKVRTRARNGNEDSALKNLAGLSKDEFRDAVIQERSWELCFEGHRRWDLLRTGKYMDAMNAVGVTAETKHLLYPIPVNELSVNPALSQNPGY